MLDSEVLAFQRARRAGGGTGAVVDQNIGKASFGGKKPVREMINFGGYNSNLIFLRIHMKKQLILFSLSSFVSLSLCAMDADQLSARITANLNRLAVQLREISYRSGSESAEIGAQRILRNQISEEIRVQQELVNQGLARVRGLQGEERFQAFMNLSTQFGEALVI